MNSSHRHETGKRIEQRKEANPHECNFFRRTIQQQQQGYEIGMYKLVQGVEPDPVRFACLAYFYQQNTGGEGDAWYFEEI